MPILDEHSLEFLSHSPDQTERLGVRLGELLSEDELLCLQGDLGAGKTTLAKGIARGWGAMNVATSPSFILINEYQRADAGKLYHFDAFRLNGESEAIDLGFTDILGAGAPILIEWPEHIQGLLPDEKLWIGLHWVDELRRGLRMEAFGQTYEKLLRNFRLTTFGG
jgi:tRNA threonylcarbamoyladenosine biosynthesis protein TsaE